MDENRDPLSRALPENVAEIRNKILNYTPPKVDSYGDGFLARAYLAAKTSTTGSTASIRDALGLDTLTYQYYMDTDPDFAVAVNMGLMDSRKEKMMSLESALMLKATGMIVEEKKIEETGAVDDDGNTVNTIRKVTKTEKQIPPDTQAILALLQRIDPSYNPKATLDVNINNNINVTEDVTINVDYRELSTSALKELLASSKKDVNNEILKTPEGKSVRFLGEQGEEALKKRAEKREIYEEKKKQERLNEAEANKGTTVKRKPMSEEQRRKISEAMKKRYSKDGKIS